MILSINYYIVEVFYISLFMIISICMYKMYKIKNKQQQNAEAVQIIKQKTSYSTLRAGHFLISAILFFIVSFAMIVSFLQTVFK